MTGTPPGPGRAAVAETHVSTLFFLGDRVYKLKKPVLTGFLDFRTRESRLAACRREVELNRRMAPDVYLGVCDVLDVDGSPLDHLVAMRRMPDTVRLATLVRSGADVRRALRQVARTVAAFHAAAERSAAVDRAGSAEAVAALWEQGFDQLRPYAGRLLDADVAGRVELLARRYVGGRGPLFRRRITAGRVVDGHGDLLADDIFCLDDGPRILDCLEFDDTLRHGDVMADCAFLAMDLERLGHPDLAAAFLRDYREFAADPAPASLVDHYVAYRAHVRCKVACLRHDQGDPAAAVEARALLGLAFSHLEAGRVSLVLLGGAPGTGKSTLAAGLAEALGWTVLRSDVVRKELGLRGGPDGLYSAETTAATYTELLRRARLLLEDGQTAVVDATWRDAAWRDSARQAAAGSQADVVELRCTVPAAVADRRVEGRRHHGRDASDATAAVAAEIRRDAHPWPEATVVDTSSEPSVSLVRALHAVGRRSPRRPA